MNKLTRSLLNARLVDLDKRISKLLHTQLQEVVRDLSSLVAHASLVAAYVEMRELGSKHEPAAKQANKVRRAVRKQLGYMVTPDIPF